VLAFGSTRRDGGGATLTATAASGYRFTGWTGACAGQGNPCTLQNVTSDAAIADGSIDEGQAEHARAALREVLTETEAGRFPPQLVRASEL